MEEGAKVSGVKGKAKKKWWGETTHRDKRERERGEI